MLDWITQWVISWGPSITQGIRDFVHWAVHAVASVMISVFSHVTDAWRDFLAGVQWIGDELGGLALDVYGFAIRVARVYLPHLWADLRFWVLWLGRVIDWVWVHAQQLVRMLRALAWSWVVWLWHAVLADVWDPLKRYADLIWHDLLKWGYVAWWWVTHLADLAEALFWYIIASLERHAWDAGKHVGQFVLSAILHNLRRFLLLMEDVLSAVL